MSRRRREQSQLYPGQPGTNDLFLFWFPKTASYEYIYFSSSSWPKDFSVQEKLNLRKSNRVSLQHKGSLHNAIFIVRGNQAKMVAATNKLEELIGDAENEGRLTDVVLNAFDSIMDDLPCKKRKLVLDNTLSENDSDVEHENIVFRSLLEQMATSREVTPVRSNNSILLLGKGCSSATDRGHQQFGNVSPNVTTAIRTSNSKHPSVLTEINISRHSQSGEKSAQGRLLEVAPARSNNSTLLRGEGCSIAVDRRHQQLFVTSSPVTGNKSRGPMFNETDHLQRKSELAGQDREKFDILITEAKKHTQLLSSIAKSLRKNERLLTSVNYDDTSTYQGLHGSFSLRQLSSNPNKAARQIVRNLYGDDFLATYIFGNNPGSGRASERPAASEEAVRIIQGAMSSKFRNYDWEQVKASLNQAGRDALRIRRTTTGNNNEAHAN
jgi:hypothetical protein